MFHKDKRMDLLKSSQSCLVMKRKIQETSYHLKNFLDFEVQSQHFLVDDLHLKRMLLNDGCCCCCWNVVVVGFVVDGDVVVVVVLMQKMKKKRMHCVTNDGYCCVMMLVVELRILK